MTLEQFNNLPEDMRGLIEDSYHDDYLFDCGKRDDVALPFETFIDQIEYRSDSGLTYFAEGLAKYNPHDVEEEGKKKFSHQKVVIGFYRKRYCVVSADKGDNYRHLWANEFFKKLKSTKDFIAANGMKLISDEIVTPSKTETTPGGRPLFNINTKTK